MARGETCHEKPRKSRWDWLDKKHKLEVRDGENNRLERVGQKVSCLGTREKTSREFVISRVHFPSKPGE